MNAYVFLSLILTLAAVFSLSYPMYRSQQERENTWHFKGKDAVDLNRKLLKRYFWTDKKLFVIGLSLTFLSVSFQLSALFS